MSRCPRCDAVAPATHMIEDRLGRRLCWRCHSEVHGSIPEALSTWDRMWLAALREATPAQRPLPVIGDEYDGNPIIEAAVRSVWAFAPGREWTISREQADAILKWWQRFPELTAPEVEAVLRRFATGAELQAHGNSGPGGPLREVDGDE